MPVDCLHKTTFSLSIMSLIATFLLLLAWPQCNSFGQQSFVISLQLLFTADTIATFKLFSVKLLVLFPYLQGKKQALQMSLCVFWGWICTLFLVQLVVVGKRSWFLFAPVFFFFSCESSVHLSWLHLLLTDCLCVIQCGGTVRTVLESCWFATGRRNGSD